jgi:hypothetical protein
MIDYQALKTEHLKTETTKGTKGTKRKTTAKDTEGTKGWKKSLTKTFVSFVVKL